ncbi:hypothetical protein L3V82_12695 [Thiotrichales bacterium 19S3-7]|nr:hypothetical protein [Thiotrichales bacterium 19S3-7]MCF6803032.1 hypothetical protein [Thiotrichales bacterium 19S3-11]
MSGKIRELFSVSKYKERSEFTDPDLPLGSRPGQSYILFGNSLKISDRLLDEDYISEVNVRHNEANWDIRNGNLTKDDYLSLTLEDRFVLERLHAIKDDVKGEININYITNPNFRDACAANYNMLHTEKNILDKFISGQTGIYDQYYYISEIIKFHKEQYSREKISDAVLGAFLKEFELDQYFPLDIQKELLENFEAINKIDTSSNKGQKFKNSCIELQEELMSDLIHQSQKKGKTLAVENEYSYQQLKNQTKMLNVVNDSTKQGHEKKQALMDYGLNAKKKSSGWAKFGKAILTVVTAGIGLVAGATTGVVSGAVIGSSVCGIGAIPGAIVGGFAGAAVGIGAGEATPLYFFTKDSKKEKMANHIVKSGQEYESH